MRAALIVLGLLVAGCGVSDQSATQPVLDTIAPVPPAAFADPISNPDPDPDRDPNLDVDLELDPDGEGELICEGMFVTIVGTDGDDVLTGTDGDDVVWGAGGDDTIDTGAGDDTICAGAGDDVISTGAGDDLVYGDEGDDILDLGEGDNAGDGGDGNDTLTAGGGSDFLYGEGGNDTIDAGGGNDSIGGGGGDDTVSTGDGDDFAIGGDGNDSIDAGPGNDECIRFEMVAGCEVDELEIPMPVVTVGNYEQEPAGIITVDSQLPGVSVEIDSNGGIPSSAIRVTWAREFSVEALWEVLASAVYDIELTGITTEFNTANITLPYYEDALDGFDAQDLRIHSYDTDFEVWVPVIGDQTIDTAEGSVTATVEHFSLFAIFKTAGSDD